MRRPEWIDPGIVDQNISMAVSELDGSSGHFARARRRVVLCRQKSTPRPFHPCHCQGSPSRILQPYRFVL